MLQFNGEEFVWNGTTVSRVKLDDLSGEERFEFLCAVAPHDPVDVILDAGAPSCARTGE